MGFYDWVCTSCGWKNSGTSICRKCSNKKVNPSSSSDWVCSSCGWVNNGTSTCRKCRNRK